jgi:hypothetical protein
MFMTIFVNSVLPYCNPFPGDMSVVIMDGAATHLKGPIRAECARVGVLALFLPPYGYVLNPTELVINTTVMHMKRKYGTIQRMPLMNGRRIGDIFAECCYECVDAHKMCNFYEHCGITVTAAERADAEAV